jgi:hypothetical protein
MAAKAMVGETSDIVVMVVLVMLATVLLLIQATWHRVRCGFSLYGGWYVKRGGGGGGAHEMGWEWQSVAVSSSK